jgi:hypothetical protein
VDLTHAGVHERGECGVGEMKLSELIFRLQVELKERGDQERILLGTDGCGYATAGEVRWSEEHRCLVIEG